MTTNLKFGNKLKAARQKLNLTQSQVAEKVGIHTNYYARIERDQVVPALETFVKLLQVLKVRSSDVLPV